MKRKSETPASARGGGPGEGEALLGGDGLWVGRHAADADILVFDPAEADPAAERLSFYSLTHHRLRTFPRAVVANQIREITDEAGAEQAKRAYEDRLARRVADEAQQEAERVERLERQRQSVLELHRRFLGELGIEYRGVRDTAKEGARRRRTRCHTCGISLDDFAGSVCVACDGVLCSCGACSCGGTLRGK